MWCFLGINGGFIDFYRIVVLIWIIIILSRGFYVVVELVSFRLNIDNDN